MLTLNGWVQCNVSGDNCFILLELQQDRSESLTLKSELVCDINLCFDPTSCNYFQEKLKVELGFIKNGLKLMGVL